MSKDATLETSKTDWQTLETTADQDIDLTDIPEVTDEQMARATLRVGGKRVSRGKVRVNMYLDADIVEYFRVKAGGRGYQTLINETLKESMLHRDLEKMLRQVIREELNLSERETVRSGT